MQDTELPTVAEMAAIRRVDAGRASPARSRAGVDQADLVGRETLVGGHDREALRACLGDEEAVEGIAMVLRKLSDPEPVSADSTVAAAASA